MEPIFEFLKYVFSFKDIALSGVAVLAILAISTFSLLYKSWHEKYPWFLPIMMGIIIIALIGVVILSIINKEKRQPAAASTLTLILHEASDYANRYIENRGKVTLYSFDEGKKASFDIFKSGIVHITPMTSWLANDSTGIQVLISNLDTLNENAIVLGNPYIFRANDTVRISYSYIEIKETDLTSSDTVNNTNKSSQISDEKKQGKKNFNSSDIVVFFNKKNERSRMPTKITTTVLNLKSAFEKKYFNQTELNNIASTTLAKDHGNTKIEEESKTLKEVNIQNGDDLWLIVQPKSYVMSAKIDTSLIKIPFQNKLIFSGQYFSKPVLKIGNEVASINRLNDNIYEAIYAVSSSPMTIVISDGDQSYIQSNVHLTSGVINLDSKSMKKIVAQNPKYIENLKFDLQETKRENSNLKLQPAFKN